jgi:hypothetical protein
MRLALGGQDELFVETKCQEKCTTAAAARFGGRLRPTARRENLKLEWFPFIDSLN